MHIIITGTRGIPNRHGGFERFAAEAARRWAAAGHRVEVYNPAGHPFRRRTWQGVTLLRKPFPHRLLGKAAVLVYDLLCFRDAYRRRPDVILNCGHGNSFFIRRKNPVPVVTLTDGLEWKRAGWHPLVRRFFRMTEKTAVKRSRAVVADHPEIARWLETRYGATPAVIAYGAGIPGDTSLPAGATPGSMLKEVLQQQEETGKKATEKISVHILPGKYFLTVARFVPENNLHMILEGYIRSGIPYPLLLTGDTDNPYGRKLLRRYDGRAGIIFTGALYDDRLLNILRHHARGYLHGHSAGGTNPALLEAMAAGCLIAAHDNPFNRYVLGEESRFFSSPEEVAALLNSWDTYIINKEQMIRQYQNRIKREYSWEKVTRQYEELFGRLIGEG